MSSLIDVLIICHGLIILLSRGTEGRQPVAPRVTGKDFTVLASNSNNNKSQRLTSVNQVFILHMCPVLRVAVTSGMEPVIGVPARPKGETCSLMLCGGRGSDEWDRERTVSHTHSHSCCPCDSSSWSNISGDGRRSPVMAHAVAPQCCWTIKKKNVDH